MRVKRGGRKGGGRILIQTESVYRELKTQQNDRPLGFLDQARKRCHDSDILKTRLLLTRKQLTEGKLT